MAKKKVSNIVRINGIDVQYNKNWAICDIPTRPDLLAKLRGQQLITLAPNDEGKLVLVRCFTNVIEELYEQEDNNQ